MIMRSIVIALALLAGAKIWTHEHIYRSATEEALIRAYRTKAIESCQRATRADQPITPTETARHALMQAWVKPDKLSLVIGNPNVEVNIWDVDHAAWAMRYRYPYVQLDAGAPAPFARCSYDVILDRASVTVL